MKTNRGPTRRLALLGIALALALAAVLTACGGDSPKADGGSAETPRTVEEYVQLVCADTEQSTTTWEDRVSGLEVRWTPSVGQD